MDNKLPLVSIGLPIYNRPQGLEQTLNCLVNQTYSNIEIIIADNCSPNTEVEKIARGFLSKDERISYYRHDANKGWGYNTNFVIEKAKGNYFMRATDDDWWDITFVEKIMSNMLKDNNVIIGISNFTFIEENKKIVNIYGIKDYLQLFKKFEGTNKKRVIKNYIDQFEGFGKPCLYFGIYKKEFLKSKFVYTILEQEFIAGDLLINLYCILRGSVKVYPEILLNITVNNQKLYQLDIIEEKKINLGIITIDYKKIKSLYKKWLGYFIYQYKVIAESPIKPMSKLYLYAIITKRISLFFYDLICVNTNMKGFNVFYRIKRKYTLE